MSMRPILVMLALLSGCQVSNREVSSERAVEITKEWWAVNSPRVPVNSFTVATADMKDRWIVIYEPSGTGPRVLFDVEKRSGNIVFVTGH
jgi:hypothetical protein